MIRSHRLTSHWLVVLFAASFPTGAANAVQRPWRDSAGVRIVRSFSNGQIREIAWVIDTANRIPIGRDTADPVATVGSVLWARVRTDGQIVVADVAPRPGDTPNDQVDTQSDRLPLRVRIFRPTGELAATVGRLGDGPGEYRSLGTIGILRGDTILTFDKKSGAVAIHSPTGTFIRESSLQEKLDWVTRARVVGSWSDGSLVFGRTGGEGSGGENLLDYISVSPDGKITTVAENQVYTPRAGSFWLMFGFASLGANRVYSSDAITFDIRIFDRRGRLTKILRPQIKPTATTEADVTRYFANPRFGRGNGMSAAEVRNLLRWMPKHLPSFQALIEDDAGNLWAQRFRVAPDEPQHWVVFDSSGTGLGQITVPSHWQIHHIGKDYLVASFRTRTAGSQLGVYPLKKRG